jgi:hypothetical protein
LILTPLTTPDFRSSHPPALSTFSNPLGYHIRMAFPINTCVICGEEFELRPGKPGFANRCPSCSDPESGEAQAQQSKDVLDRKNESEMNAERRRVIRDMLYRKDS